MTPARVTVLVVDDEPDMRKMLAYDLSQEGYEVFTAEDGYAALEAVRKRKFDLVITDLKMPGMDGVETVAALKSIEPETEIIVATAYATVETAVECMRRGAFDYIRKPYNLDEMRMLVERVLVPDGARADEVLEQEAGKPGTARAAAGQVTVETPLERLAAGLAHEINNPLAIVHANLYALKDYSMTVGELWAVAKEAAACLRGLKSPPGLQLAARLVGGAGDEARTESLFAEIAAIIDETEKAVLRIADLVAGLSRLAYWHGAQALRNEVDLVQVLNESLDSLATHPGSRSYHVDTPGEVVAVRASRHDLRTAFVYLLRYARTRTGVEGAAVRITVGRKDGVPTIDFHLPDLTLIASERCRFFEPRFEESEQESRVRFDMDLALAHRLLRRNGAEIDLADRPHGGMVISVRFSKAR